MKSFRHVGALHASSTLRLCAVLIAYVALYQTAAFAQRWEYTYGTGVENGRKRVTPVLHCTGGGYIAVGSTDFGQPGADHDLYVVHTNNNGAHVWEFGYDITGLSYDDEGWALAEKPDGSGFVITGTTSYIDPDNPDCPTRDVSDVFILEIDCDGAVQWAKTYGGACISEGGLDIIIAKTGSVVEQTAIGDLVVAGYANNPDNGRVHDGLLFRTTSAGILRWDARYNLGGQAVTGDVFSGVTELTAIAPVLTGDLLAVGGELTPSQQGAIVRASGINGGIGAAPQGAAAFGVVAPQQTEYFYAGIEQQRPAAVDQQTGRKSVVVIGEHNNQSDIYAVRLVGGDPCLSVALEQVIGIPGDIDLGTDIIELNNTIAQYNSTLMVWDLVLTGFHDAPATADPGEAILLALNSLNLAPAPARLAKAFNAGRANTREEGWSLNPRYPATTTESFGLVVCGLTSSGTGTAGTDMYLFKTDPLGQTGCEVAYTAVGATINTRACRTPDIISLSHVTDQTPVDRALDQDINVCPQLSKSGPASAARAAFDVSLAPNPVSADHPLTLSIGAGGPVAITLSNSLGAVLTTVEHAEVDASGSLTIPTFGLLPGAYNVTVRRGSERVTVRFVVVE